MAIRSKSYNGKFPLLGGNRPASGSFGAKNGDRKGTFEWLYFKPTSISPISIPL
jgi:hypothetical protein